jgi:hypothetical protein
VHQSVDTVREIAVQAGLVVVRQVVVGAASCRQAWVSKDDLTPAIAVLTESFKPEDFVIDCDGCTACCRGHEGVKLDDGERHDYISYKDDKGEWRVQQVDGECIYLADDGTKGCVIHQTAPRRCQEFDCRSAVIFFGRLGLDELVREAKLPLEVVEQGRKKLAEWNQVMNVRALSGGADLSFLMKGDDDAG